MTDRRLPAERFYLVRLDTAGIGRAKGNRRVERLGCLFEEFLPVPVEQVQAVYLDAGPDAVLACGMERSDLSAEAERVLTLGPSSLPRYLDCDHVDPTTLNLLVGDFEPATLRRARNRLGLEAAGVVLLCSVALAAGMERRITEVGEQAAALNHATADAYQAVLPPSTGPVPDSVRLTTELRRLRATRNGGQTETAVADAALGLASLLERWPEAAQTRTELLSVGGNGARVTAAVPDAAAGQALVSALDGGAWDVTRHQVSQSRSGVQVQLTLSAGSTP